MAGWSHDDIPHRSQQSDDAVALGGAVVVAEAAYSGVQGAVGSWRRWYLQWYNAITWNGRELLRKKFSWKETIES